MNNEQKKKEERKKDLSLFFDSFMTITVFILFFSIIGYNIFHFSRLYSLVPENFVQILIIGNFLLFGILAHGYFESMQELLKKKKQKK